MGDIVEFVFKVVERLVREGHLPAFLIGVALASSIVVALGPKLFKSFQRSMSDEIVRQHAKLTELSTRSEQLHEQIDTLEDERDRLRDAHSELSGRYASEQEKVRETSEACELLKADMFQAQTLERKARRRRKELKGQILALTRQLSDITTIDGKVWHRPPHGRVAQFRPLSLRKTPIISVVNLKGGVGKTSITANVGVAFARKGYRVLLIDLDHQGTLTSLCSTGQELKDTLRSGRLIHEVMLAAEGADAELHRCSIRLQSTMPGEVFLVGANGKFGDVETQLHERWIAGALADDVRYRLRAALHTSNLRDRYDIVLLDCPPRLSIGCINALAASDYLLTPVVNDRSSTETVPFLLQWLNELRPGMCPELSILGIVSNRSKLYKEKLVARELAIWETLGVECLKAWGEPVHQFGAFIPDHSSSKPRLAALNDKVLPRYLKLVEEILKELPAHARLHPSATHPLAAAPAASLGR